MATPETSAAVAEKVGKAMEELAVKGEMQRMAKARAEAESAAREAEEEERMELEALRKARLDRMRKEVESSKLRTAGELRLISQDEFLTTVTSHPRVVVLFFNSSFEQCAVMEQRLREVAMRHPETLFARIDAERAPFFVQKLAIRTLPPSAGFEDGKLVGKQIGFSGIPEGALSSAAAVVAGLERALDAMGVLDAKVDGASRKAPAAGRREVDDDDFGEE